MRWDRAYSMPGSFVKLSGRTEIGQPVEESSQVVLCWKNSRVDGSASHISRMSPLSGLPVIGLMPLVWPRSWVMTGSVASHCTLANCPGLRVAS